MRELKSPVDYIVSDGRAATDVRKRLATDPAILEDKKVVIWEFVERRHRPGARRLGGRAVAARDGIIVFPGNWNDHIGQALREHLIHVARSNRDGPCRLPQELLV